MSKIFIIIAAIVLIFPKPVFADQFITVVNPIRISTYSTNPKESLANQYSEVKRRELPATWLFTYDALSNPELINEALKMDNSQELGLFLEVTPIFAIEANVLYNKTDSWHRANSVFLSGYTQEDRKKLIEKSFKRFKDTFGYYPSSVGAWWVDAFSLDYMQKKYGIISVLIVADQFATDGYQIWGQFWSTPFYPSKFHTGMPAITLDSKLDVVITQWAARDPLNGYGRGGASLFSTQDRFEKEYSQKLVDVYAKRNSNKFGQIVLGLEGDFPPSSYSSGTFFSNWLDIVKTAKQNDDISVVTMKDFSNWYRSNFPKLSPVQIIQSDDLLGKRVKTFWYNSINYRVNITYNADNKETIIRDFRSYHDNFQEPFYVSPNRELNLSINLPSQIDSASNPDEEWKALIEELEKVESDQEMLTLTYKNNKQITFTKSEMKASSNIKDIPKAISQSQQLDVKREANIVSIKPKASWNYPKEGLKFRALTQEATYFLKQKKVIAVEVFLVFLFIGLKIILGKRKVSAIWQLIVFSTLLSVLSAASYYWYSLNSKEYFVNQSELDALNRLRNMKGKRVIVYDKYCLQCSWHTPLMPAIFANKRDYVKRITNKNIVYNSSIFEAKTRPEAKQELEKLNADYIYLVKFEDYKELAPFSPGDLNIEEIYSNSNAQIWKIKKS